jgi:hypothetical protein
MHFDTTRPRIRGAQVRCKVRPTSVYTRFQRHTKTATEWHVYVAHSLTSFQKWEQRARAAAAAGVGVGGYLFD